MCGIFAYIGNDDHAALKAVRGLKDLEYRGYDSWGIVIKTKNGITTKRAIGKVSDVLEDDFKNIRGRVALGHTRWATHGGVSIRNTHPHFNTDKTIAVVHNGIIENHVELRDELNNLLGKDVFRSQTDTEVIPHLIDHFIKKGLSFENAFVKASKKLKGRFAFVALHKNESFILATRDGSPLIVGKGADGYYLASDMPAFLCYTNIVNFIENGEYIKCSDKSVAFFNIKTGKQIKKEDKEIVWNKERASKEGWDYFMIKEIMSQKETLSLALKQEKKDIEKALNMIKTASNVIFTACGTAGNICMAAEYYFSNIAQKKTSFVYASEFHKVIPFINSKTLIITVTQSGETADLLEAIKEAKEKKAKIFSILNTRGSTVERESDHFLPINAGQEKAVASTKASSSQLILLLLLSYGLAGKLKKGEKTILKAIKVINSWLTKQLLKSLKQITTHFAKKDHLYIIGKSNLNPIALEAALKIKEVSYIHAEGFPAGELKHGPIALIEKGTPCIVLINNDEFEADILNSAQELKARGAYLIGISPNKKNPLFDLWVQIPKIGEATLFGHLIVIQILAYYSALLRGHDPDKPRNLAKSVTVK